MRWNSAPVWPVSYMFSARLVPVISDQRSCFCWGKHPLAMMLPPPYFSVVMLYLGWCGLKDVTFLMLSNQSTSLHMLAVYVANYKHKFIWGFFFMSFMASFLLLFENEQICPVLQMRTTNINFNWFFHLSYKSVQQLQSNNWSFGCGSD